MLTRQNIEELIAFAHKHRLFIFADEVYQDNVYDAKSKFISFKKVGLGRGSMGRAAAARSSSDRAMPAGADGDGCALLGSRAGVLYVREQGLHGRVRAARRLDGASEPAAHRASAPLQDHQRHAVPLGAGADRRGLRGEWATGAGLRGPPRRGR